MLVYLDIDTGTWTMKMAGVKKKDVSRRQSFKINVLSFKPLKTTTIPRFTSPATKSLPTKTSFIARKQQNDKNKRKDLENKSGLSETFHFNEKKKNSKDVLGKKDVIYTLGVSLSSMVVITVIAVLIIFVIKRRRQRMLKDSNANLNLKRTTNNGT